MIDLNHQTTENAMIDLNQHLDPTIRTIEATLKESRKRIDGERPTPALWFLYRALLKLEETEAILAAYEREAQR